jgi:hypothetical protein
MMGKITVSRDLYSALFLFINSLPKTHNLFAALVSHGSGRDVKKMRPAAFYGDFEKIVRSIENILASRQSFMFFLFL